MHCDREVALREDTSVTFYKLRHKPSGLFFRGYETGKQTNLSKIGKVYQTKPSLAYVKDGYYDKDKKYITYVGRECIEDWEIVEYRAVEIDGA